MHDLLHICYFQTELIWENPSKNRRHFETLIADNAPQTDVVILPEMFTTGFSMNAKSKAESFEANLNWFKRTAETYQVALMGSVMCYDQNAYYNRLIFMRPDGQYETYDKRHLFSLAKEHEVYTAGQNHLIVNYKGWRIYPLICYDLRFPVWSRNTQNYDVLVYVANWPEKRILAWDALLKARAIENMSYTVGVNRIGKDGNDFNYVGHSAVYDFLGTKISHHNADSQAACHVTLDYRQQKEARQKLNFLNDRDQFTIN